MLFLCTRETGIKKQQQQPTTTFCFFNAGHRLKNQDSLTLGALTSLETDARLLISATPLQNNLSEFYNLVEFVAVRTPWHLIPPWFSLECS